MGILGGHCLASLPQLANQNTKFSQQQPQLWVSEGAQAGPIRGNPGTCAGANMKRLSLLALELGGGGWTPT